MRKMLLAVAIIFFTFAAKADEGMWLLKELKIGRAHV